MESLMAEGLRSRSSGLKPIETKRKGGIEEYGMVTVEDEPLSPMARLFHYRRFDIHAVVFMACKTRISPQPVKEKLVHTLLKHPRFTSLMSLNFRQNIKKYFESMSSKKDLGILVYPEEELGGVRRFR
ncbi:hypothetical protein KY284_004989 [Solanum tuberosum]|nr:hypothetical protein KY284_004989 [Solanum tuberosum]